MGETKAESGCFPFLRKHSITKFCNKKAASVAFPEGNLASGGPNPRKTTRSSTSHRGHPIDPNDRRDLPTVVSIPVMALGAELRLKELETYLNDQRAQIIGISGPAGVGKTTLLKAFNNTFLSSEHGFDVVVFASASLDSDVGRLQVAISKRLGLPWQANESKERKAARISLALEKKRYLLMLDDIWSRLDLDEVGIPLPDGRNRCKVLFATRYQQVCRDMGATLTIRVDPLELEMAWQLFQRFAGKASSSPEIIDVARDVACECDGLPLGLMTVGRSMATATSREEWIEGLAMLRQSKEEFQQGKHEIFPGMEPVLFHFDCSHRRLAPKELRDCIAYCSLFPRNHSIKKKELVSYWLGEGFLDDSCGTDRACRQAEDYMEELKAMGMLKDGDKPDLEVMMHDILRELILDIKKNEFLVQAGTGLAYVPKVQNSAEAEKLSLMCNYIHDPGAAASNPKLGTLILKRNFRLKKLADDSFTDATALRLVDFSYTGMKAIPSSIGRLVQLRHLDLSFTKIKSLPKEIGELVNLMQLLLEGTNKLSVISENVISKLSKLVVLNMYGSYGDWEVEGREGDVKSRGASIEELECLNRLSDLGITICNTTAWERFLRSHTLSKSTGLLNLKGCGDLNSVHLSSSLENLREVTISDCILLQELKIGGYGKEIDEETWQLPHLEVLCLKALYEAEIVWSGAITPKCLPMLRKLDISFCHRLKDISWVLLLEHMEHINIDTCKKMEEMIGGERDVHVPGHLPRLKTLTLRNLPKLKSLCEQPLSVPSLEYIKVLECPQLTLPHLTGGSIPGVIHGEKEWWNALDMKTSMQEFSSFWFFQVAE
ncbi:LOW QUALITY PROTEIN: disease resistance protein RPS2-like [Phoenix dactylifera]|uniref:LOW QUALITY PROTEIN: disease resistance protein RPS2-like n=1 Tax=Phoenix dactylifera TaxID=42345 RepID=A0A8B7CQL7_PHODC|nr:LOW QUALITY PROTEIN: disease resistance protein RPS2-like [Phoenix dactylifera]